MKKVFSGKSRVTNNQQQLQHSGHIPTVLPGQWHWSEILTRPSWFLSAEHQGLGSELHAVRAELELPVPLTMKVQGPLPGNKNDVTI